MFDQSIPTSFFKNNRAELFNSLKVNALIVTANGLIQKSADQAFPFRQDSNFYYLTGIDEPDLVLVITNEEEFIITSDFFTKNQAITGPINTNHLSQISGIDSFKNERAGWQTINKVIKASNKIATLMPSPTKLPHYGIYTNPARRQLLIKIKRSLPGIEITDARKQLATKRMVKKPIELSLIQKAIDITSDTLRDVLSINKLSRYKDTNEVNRAILDGFLSRGGTGHAFDPIVAVGKDAVAIHYPKLGQTLEEGQLMVCDVGSSYDHYGADITRTVSLGNPSSRQVAVFNAVKHVQSEAMKLLKPGVNFKDYELKVEKLICERLNDLNLIKGSKTKDIREYYTHACSHSLGLDIHDAVDYTQPIKEGMVMTVEPGIYIKEEGIGVRLEDVVHITNHGCELMSKNLPSSLKLN